MCDKKDPLLEPKFEMNKLYQRDDTIYRVLFVSEHCAVLASVNTDVVTEVATFHNCNMHYKLVTPFELLKMDEPVWIRTRPTEHWVPRHYALNKQVWVNGLTSHTGDAKTGFQYWKHEKYGEWKNQ